MIAVLTWHELTLSLLDTMWSMQAAEKHAKTDTKESSHGPLACIKELHQEAGVLVGAPALVQAVRATPLLVPHTSPGGQNRIRKRSSVQSRIHGTPKWDSLHLSSVAAAAYPKILHAASPGVAILLQTMSSYELSLTTLQLGLL